jgi:hypothetical protein
LGHSDPKVTLAVYTQVLDNEIDEAGDILKIMVDRAHSSEMRMPNLAFLRLSA